MALGKTIRALREARGWSQNELARRSNVPQASVQRIETADAGASVHNVAKIARALEVPIETLLDTEVASALVDRIDEHERRIAALEGRL